MAGTIFSDLITTNALPDSIRTIYSNELEFTSRPNLVYDQPAFVESRDEFSAKRGNQVIWTIYHQLPTSIAPLTENQDVVGGSVEDHQVSFTVQEYGNAIGTTEALDLTSYHGPISNIVRTLLSPSQALTMDTLARNMLWYAPNRALMDPTLQGPMFKTYTGGATSRATLSTSTSVMTSDVARAAAYRLTVRRVPTLGGQQPSYVCITHPSVTYDLRSDPYWKDAMLYAGSTAIFTGEEGMIHGVRFIKSDRARIANGGLLAAQTAQTTLSANIPAGTNSITVAAATGLSVGEEITLHHTGNSTTAPVNSVSTTWFAPDGTDPTAEEMIIKSISGTTVTFTQKTILPHSAGDYVTNALDVYPMIFMGGLAPLGKGTVVPPEIRVSLPTDKLRRMSYIGWYSLMGFGVVRDWAYEVCDTLASINTPPVYSF
jgi:N4-gp56 family major capsid protein